MSRRILQGGLGLVHLKTAPAVCITTILLAFAVAACGVASKPQSPPSARPGTSAKPGAISGALEHDGDADDDSPGVGARDFDNDASPTYGAPAAPTDEQAIVALVKSYYAAAFSDNGGRACLLMGRAAREALLEADGRERGSRPSRGASCAQAASRFFRRHRRELSEGIALLRVPVVQVHGNRGWAVVSLGGAREHVAFLHREAASWKLNQMLGYGDAL